MGKDVRIDIAKDSEKQPTKNNMAKYKLEYLWLDGYTPVANIRGKTKIQEFVLFQPPQEIMRLTKLIITQRFQN